MLKLTHSLNLGGGVTSNSLIGKAFTKQSKKAFTLAEVLITIGVIGLVSALTLPTLLNTINGKVQERQIQVMKRKLVQGLNLYNNQEDGLIRSYNNTEEFVRGLSKHLKMIQICGKDELNKCFPYDKINYVKRDGTIDNVAISTINTAKKLQLKDDSYLDPAGFIMADGTPFIMTFNKKCAEAKDDYGHNLISPDTPLKDIPINCIDGLWDINGSKSPNTYDKDIHTLFSAKIGTNCVHEINGVCMGTEPFIQTTALTSADCNANKSKYGITNCRTDDDDYWGGAMKACKEQGMRLANSEDVAKIATELYGINVGPEQQIYSGVTLNQAKAAEYGFQNTSGTSDWFNLWVGQEANELSAATRFFDTTYTFWFSSNDRLAPDRQAFCVAE